MVTGRVASAWMLCAVAACGGVEPEVRRPQAGATAPAASPPPVPPPPAPVIRGPELEPLPRVSAAVEGALRVVSPQPGVVLASDDAAAAPVRVEATEFLSGDPRRRIAVVLDDERVRYLTKDAPAYTLRDFVSPDRDLTAAEHRLVALLVDEQGQIVKQAEGGGSAAVVRFRVGAPAPPSTEAGPVLVLAEPQGTYNGPAAAEEARLDYYVDESSRDPARGYRVEVTWRFDEGSTSASLPGWSAYRITGLRSGDYEVELALIDQRGAVVARSSRKFTVNLDAPVPKAAP